MKAQNLQKTDIIVLMSLAILIVSLGIFCWYIKYEPHSELYKKSVRQIQYYKNNPSEPIYISNEMCWYSEEKNGEIACDWNKDFPYYYASSIYDAEKDQWYLLVREKGSEDEKRISTESVRITNSKIFDNDYTMYIDIKKASQLNSRTQFEEHRPYFYIPLEHKILVLDQLGNQVTLPKYIHVPTPPLE